MDDTRGPGSRRRRWPPLYVFLGVVALVGVSLVAVILARSALNKLDGFGPVKRDAKVMFQAFSGDEPQNYQQSGSRFPLAASGPSVEATGPIAPGQRGSTVRQALDRARTALANAGYLVSSDSAADRNECDLGLSASWMPIAPPATVSLTCEVLGSKRSGFATIGVRMQVKPEQLKPTIDYTGREVADPDAALDLLVGSATADVYVTT